MIRLASPTSVQASKAHPMSPQRQRWLSHFEDQAMKRRNSNALDRFEKSAGVRAEVLLKRTRAQIRSDYPEDAEDAFQKFYDDMRRRGLKDESASQWISVVRGFFRANGVPLPPLLLMRSVGPPGPHGLPFNQLDVKRMIRRLANAPKQSLLITRRNRAVIAFLAQTGQKEGILAGITWEMVREGNEAARRHRYPSHALIEIDPEFPKNQLGRRYRFVIGSDAMRLMERLPRPHIGKVFMSVRTIGRIVDSAAKKCGLQREKERRYRGWKSHAVIRRCSGNTGNFKCGREA